MTHKAKANLGREVAHKFLNDVLVRFWKVMPSPELYREALDVQERNQFSFYDALIVAAALESGCKLLYIEDLQHGQWVSSLQIRNPFEA